MAVNGAPSLAEVAARVFILENETVRLRERVHAMPHELTIPIQDQIVDLRITVGRQAEQFNAIKATAEDLREMAHALQSSIDKRLGRAEFTRLMSVAIGSGTVVAGIVVWMLSQKP